MVQMNTKTPEKRFSYVIKLTFLCNYGCDFYNQEFKGEFLTYKGSSHERLPLSSSHQNLDDLRNLRGANNVNSSLNSSPCFFV